MLALAEHQNGAGSVMFALSGAVHGDFSNILSFDDTAACTEPNASHIIKLVANETRMCFKRAYLFVMAFVETAI